jgi:hypothetical protein
MVSLGTFITSSNIIEAARWLSFLPSIDITVSIKERAEVQNLELLLAQFSATKIRYGHTVFRSKAPGNVVPENMLLAIHVICGPGQLQ